MKPTRRGFFGWLAVALLPKPTLSTPSILVGSGPIVVPPIGNVRYPGVLGVGDYIPSRFTVPLNPVLDDSAWRYLGLQSADRSNSSPSDTPEKSANIC